MHATATRPATAPTPDLSTDEYLTPATAARRLDCNITTIYRWLTAGKLRGYRVAGHRFVIRAADLAEVVRPVCPTTC